MTRKGQAQGQALRGQALMSVVQSGKNEMKRVPVFRSLVEIHRSYVGTSRVHTR
jgi:hypothetical protein